MNGYMGYLFALIHTDHKDNSIGKTWSIKKGHELEESITAPFLFSCHQGINDEHEAGVPSLIHIGISAMGSSESKNFTRFTEIWAFKGQDAEEITRVLREWANIPNPIPFGTIWYKSLLIASLQTKSAASELLTDEFMEILLRGGKNGKKHTH